MSTYFQIRDRFEAAAAAGNYAQVKDLLIQLNEIDDSDPSTPTDFSHAFTNAVLHDHMEIVQLFIVHGEEATSGIMINALNWNASNEMLQLLVDHGVNVNARTSTGRPILEYAMDDERKLEFLLDQGADPNAKAERTKLTVVDHAAAGDSVERLCFLLNNGAKLELANPLWTAAAAGGDSDRVPLLKYLIDNCHLDVNTVNTLGRRFTKKRGDEGCTPLQSALIRGRRDRIEFLLSRGADSEAKSE